LHPIFLELKDSQAAALFGFVLAFLIIFFWREQPTRSTRGLILSSILLIVVGALLGWVIYFVAYFTKIVTTEPAFHIKWDLALAYFKGGRGAYPIRTYGVAMASAFAINLVLLHRRAPLEGLSSKTIVNTSICVILGTLIGGRMLFVITQWSKYAEEPLGLIKFWEGGLVFYGGYIGSFVAAMIYIWGVKRQRYLPYPDIMAPYFGLGLAIHRSFGCYLNGCCYGAPTTLPWAVRFPLTQHGTKFYGAEAFLHPTQLYEALAALTIFFALLWFRPRRKYYGQSTALMCIMYAVFRFSIEMVRGDQMRGTVGTFSTSQFISLGFFIIGVALLIFAQVSKRKVWRSGDPLIEGDEELMESTPTGESTKLAD